MHQQIPWEDLARYFAGECSKQEEEEMESWINADPERKEQVQQLYKIWNESGTPPFRLDEDQSWEVLSQHMDRLDREKAAAAKRSVRSPVVSVPGKLTHYYDKQRSRKSGHGIRRMAMAAAAAAILAAAGLFGYYNYQVNLAAEEAAGVAIQHLEAGEGERASFTLGDGTRVILHAESRLEVPVQFASGNRELHLQGEAWFDVAHNPEQPFLVHSEHALTRVLGTKFLVQAWPDREGEVEVVVSEGRVALGHSPSFDADDRQEVTVSQNQKGSLTRNSSPVVTELTDTEMAWYLGWTEGRLIFEDRPLGDIIPRLERWYVLDIHLEDPGIAGKKLSAEIDYNQPMSEVLAAIALSLGLDVEREGRTVTFRSGNND